MYCKNCEGRHADAAEKALCLAACSWCDEPATIDLGVYDQRCDFHDELWFRWQRISPIVAAGMLNDGQVSE